MEIYFDDPRLQMTVAGRLLVRIIYYIYHLVLIVAAATFLMSDVPWLRWLGIFLLIFFIDRALHFGEGDRPFSELPQKGKVNLARYMRPKAFSAIEKSFDGSILTGKNFFLGIVAQTVHIGEIGDGLKRLGVEPDEFRQKLDELLVESEGVSEGGRNDQIHLRDQAETLVIKAFRIALESRCQFVGPSHLFSALLHIEDRFVGRLFNIFSVEAGDLERALLFSSVRRRAFLRLPGALGGFVSESERGIRHRVMNRAWTSRPTPTLDKYSVDFTDLARHRKIGFLVGHDEEYRRIVETLARPVNPNVLLVGDAGIGKETMIAHLAFELEKDRVPAGLFDKRLVSLQLTALAAGSTPGELQERIRRVVGEIIAAGNIVLYIPDIHNLVNTSGTAYLSAADALMPIVMNNAFPVLGTTYPKEFKSLIEPRSDFTEAFEIIRVEEISEIDAQKLLVYESIILERQSGIFITLGSIKKAVELAKRYFRGKTLPSSAEELFKSALVEAKRREEKILGTDAVIRAAEEKINIPIHEAGKGEAEKLLHLEDIIHERLVDQEEAVHAVASAIREYRSGMTRKGGPIASFLFVGPTGVGKTELAKILARIQFGSESAIIRFDMTEYQDKQSFYRFIGSPNGEVSGALTDAVLKTPYSLILLDEFEKAYPDILDLFLQMFDDGRLTDNLGRTVDFQNTLIIATSNAHSDIINSALSGGQSMANIADYLKKKLVDVFRPELLNRFSKVVVFKNLSPDNLEKIVKLNLADLARTLGEKGVTILFDPAVIGKLVQLGYDPVFGARPLRRIVDEKIRSILAEKILKGELPRGVEVRCILKGEDLEIVPKK